ncbi:MAG: MBL fold metallo-hydrolase [Methanobrevibacter millerae]|uniref:MBL fold metallo-hydrolase n=1 Tax=Methanobrevibacter millerae TaxID=230361 RepID=A0A8T3V9B3_9EURY|nr:MBL fold metallo-hydrolase [Methanobrevibacter millerae]MBE6504327.1 MBL fold metallo-hydrolase [Methanobrevibacter millerae]
MKIIFLGTGGGRFSAINQRRMTGGFRIENLGGKNYHIDPGPGALVRTYQFGLDPRNIDGVFVSHAHTDHYNDAEILIEAMTKGMTTNYGYVMGAKSVISGFESWGPCISSYHQTKSKILALEEGDVRYFDNCLIKATPTIHGDPKGVGFQIEFRDFKISYTSDTSYFPELSKAHEGADVFIASVLRPGGKAIKGHLCSSGFIKLLKEIKPKLAIMTHLGLKMISNNPIGEAKRITKLTGVKTLAAFDGMSLDINFNNPAKARIVSLKDVDAPYHGSNPNLSTFERRNTNKLAMKHGETDEFVKMRKHRY